MNSSYFNYLQPHSKVILDVVCKQFDKGFLRQLGKKGKKTKKTISSTNPKKKTSASTYKSAINNLCNQLSKVKGLPPFVYDFPEIIAVLCEYGEIENAKKVVQVVYYTILSYNLRKTDHNTGTAIKDYVDYILKKRKNSKPKGIPSWLNGCINSIKTDLDTYLSKHDFFPQSDLIGKMESRLRRQDRVSGDKVWLPLSIIAKIYNPIKHPTKDIRFIEWINSIAVNIYIHYKDGTTVDSAKLKDVAALDFEKSGKDKKVYVILKTGGRFEALTPTGILNNKDEVLVESIEGLVIDHIKPIDLTLRDLGNKSKLPRLEQIKLTMLKYLNDKDRDDKTLNDLMKSGILTSPFKDDLLKELEAIRDDSPCRLMKSDLNGTKSNMTEYKYIRKVQNKKEYYGIVYGDGATETCKDISSNDYVICHKLDNSIFPTGIMIYTKAAFSSLGLDSKRIKITRININLI